MLGALYPTGGQVSEEGRCALAAHTERIPPEREAQQGESLDLIDNAVCQRSGL